MSSSAKAPEGQAISEGAQAEGGTTKGAPSAPVHSQLNKQLTAEQDVDQVSVELATGAKISSDDEDRMSRGQILPSRDVQPPAAGVAPAAQSAADKQANFEEAAQEVVGKVKQDFGSVTKEDISCPESREARAQRGGRPPKDSTSAEAKRLAAANESSNTPSTSTTPIGNTFNGTNDNPQVPPDVQSALDKENNFKQAAEIVGAKIANDPESLTKEDAAYLDSREQRAHGVVEKGGIAAQAMGLADKNEQ